MGSMLSSPLTSKGLHRVGNNEFKVAACEMQGHRLTMEDAHSIILDFTPNSAFVGIFDGHGNGGEWSSEWFAKNLPTFIKAKGTFKKKDIISACLEADATFIEESTKTGKPYKDTGTTAIFCIIEEIKKPKDPAKPYKLIIGNIGDSRCILLRDGEDFKSITHDHKPGNQEETNRIVAAGGNVANGRVDGMLAISRALGDHQFKNNSTIHPTQQRVSAVPDIYTVDGVGEDDMIFLFCDGIYEGSSNENAVSALLFYLKQHPEDPALALSMLFDKQVMHSQDNMSSILVQFKDGSGYSNVSQQGEHEYVPCAMASGAEFSRAFVKFGTRYGSSNGQAPKKKNIDAKEPNGTHAEHNGEKKERKRKEKEDTPEELEDTDEEPEDDETALAPALRKSGRLLRTKSYTASPKRSASAPAGTTTSTSSTTDTAVGTEKRGRKRAKKA